MMIIYDYIKIIKNIFLPKTWIYCIQLLIRQVLFSPRRYPRLICPVLNLPTLQFYYIILNVLFSFKFALKPEGRKKNVGENFPVYSNLLLKQKFPFYKRYIAYQYIQIYRNLKWK